MQHPLSRLKRKGSPRYLTKASQLIAHTHIGLKIPTPVPTNSLWELYVGNRIVSLRYKMWADVTEASARANTMSPTILTYLPIAIGALFLFLTRRNIANSKGLPYPPGPKAFPLLGNALDMPKSYYWLTFADWAKQYGDITHVRLFGSHYIILNSFRAIDDLLEKRSSIYSDRPRLVMMNELYVFPFWRDISDNPLSDSCQIGWDGIGRCHFYRTARGGESSTRYSTNISI